MVHHHIPAGAGHRKPVATCIEIGWKLIEPLTEYDSSRIELPRRFPVAEHLLRIGVIAAVRYQPLKHSD